MQEFIMSIKRLTPYQMWMDVKQTKITTNIPIKPFKEWFYEQYPNVIIYNPFDLKWYFNLSELDYRMLKFQDKKLLLVRPRPQSLLDAFLSNCIQYRSKVNELSPWEERQSKIAFMSFLLFQEKLKEARKAQ